MEIRDVAIERLNPAPYNPRVDLQPGDPDYEKLKNSIDAFGYVDPIVWNEATGNVIGGHQRLKILIAQGETQLPVSVVNMTEAEEKALNIALNKIRGEWDNEGLDALINELYADANIDELLTGFEAEEIDAIVNGISDSFIDSFNEEDMGITDDYNESDEFAITLIFPKQYEDAVKSFIRENKKQTIVDMILREVGESEAVPEDE